MNEIRVRAKIMIFLFRGAAPLPPGHPQGGAAGAAE
jgi:hypothetical protein